MELSETVPQIPVSRDWYFTFGVGHPVHAGKYVVFHGTHASAREQMFTRFGTEWAFQYPSAEEVGVELWKLQRLTVEHGDPGTREENS